MFIIDFVEFRLKFCFPGFDSHPKRTDFDPKTIRYIVVCSWAWASQDVASTFLPARQMCSSRFDALRLAVPLCCLLLLCLLLWGPVSEPCGVAGRFPAFASPCLFPLSLLAALASGFRLRAFAGRLPASSALAVPAAWPCWLALCCFAASCPAACCLLL